MKSCEKAAEFINNKFGAVAETVIVLGSGQGGVAQAVKVENELLFEEIPGFAPSTVKGHSGKLLSGRFTEKPVTVQAGRLHFYEGHSLSDVVFPIRTLILAGAKKIIMLNAAGGINKQLLPGSLMLLTDHINYAGQNPLIGDKTHNFGERFIDMSNCYDKELREKTSAAAKRANIKLFEGVYLWTLGPSYETPAEIRFFSKIGADAVGMSTVPEVIAARQLGAKVLAISLITNKAAGLADQLSHGEVIETAEKAQVDMISLLKELLMFDF